MAFLKDLLKIVSTARKGGATARALRASSFGPGSQLSAQESFPADATDVGASNQRQTLWKGVIRLWPKRPSARIVLNFRLCSDSI
jgi:hypothetical protein